MEAQGIIKLKSLEPYRHLFPKATGIDHSVKTGADVSDTVQFMPQAAEQSRWMVRDFVNQELKGLTTYQACKKLWHFVKEHIQYEKDAKTKEQVRSARRLIADGKGDCDCMTNFVNACMLEFGVVGIINRITEYENRGYFQHIYSLIPDGKGNYIIMDCVWHSFNKEKQYTKKEDHIMELQFLDGIGDTDGLKGLANQYTNLDAQDLFGNEDEFGDLGKLFRKKASGDSGGAKKGLFHKRSAEQKQAGKQKRKAFMQKGRKVFHVLNKLNPATAILRAGILASMKLNVMKVAETLKWSYASRELAQSKGMDMSKYDKLQHVKDRIEKIFFASGGKPENLRKAILTGRGNRNKEVSGFDGLSEDMALSQLLGSVYQDEFIYGMEGFEGFEGVDGSHSLGEPATGTAIAAASTVMGSLAALIKSIGSLFPKGKKGAATKSDADEGGSDADSTDPGSDSSSEEAPESAEPESTVLPDEDNSPENLPATTEESTEVIPAEENAESEEPKEESTEGLDGIGTKLKTFYQNNKKWIIPVGVAVGIGTIAYIINQSNSNKGGDKFQKQLDGMKKENKKPRKKKKADKKNNTAKRSVIQLM